MGKQKVTFEAVKTAGLIPISLLLVAIFVIVFSGMIAFVEVRLGIEIPPWAIGFISAVISIPLLNAYLRRRLSSRQE